MKTVTTTTLQEKPTQSKIEPKPAPISPKEARQTEYRRRLAEIQSVRAFLDLNEDDLEAIDMFRLIRSRTFCGVDGPIEKFLAGLLRDYMRAENNGEGLTVEDIESDIEELRENMTEAISEAYFIADRYPRPQPANTSKEEVRS